MNNNDQKFIAEKIRSEYIAKSPEHTQLEKLRMLDAKVRRPANTFAYVLGSISALVMGSGMSLVMTDIGDMIGVKEAMVPGIVIGVIGMIMAIVNYPVYKKMLAKRKNKYADKILELSNEIISE